MSIYACHTEDGTVTCIVSADEAPPSSVLLPDAATPHYPPPPFDGAVLRVVGGALEWVDARPLVAVKALRWAAIKTERDARDAAPIDLGGYTVQVDLSTSIPRLREAILAMQLNGQAERSWVCTDNVMRTLTIEQLLDVVTAATERRQALIETSADLYDQIQAAATAAEVAAVVWPAD